MSLATMGRKSRTTNPRLRRQPCFVLNMTGRGNVIGRSFNAGQCRGKRPFYGKCKMGGQVTCCAADRATPENCKKGCGCQYKGLSQPAPQMGYGIYLNRRSRGASRPGGGKCCSTLADLSQNKLTWKQSTSYDASLVTETKRLAQLRCSYRVYDKVSHKITAKISDCIANGSGARSAYGNCCKCECRWPITKPRLSYTRINHNRCGTTKTLCVTHSASEQTAMIKSGTKKCGINPTTGDKLPDAVHAPIPNSYTPAQNVNKSRCHNPYAS